MLFVCVALTQSVADAWFSHVHVAHQRWSVDRRSQHIAKAFLTEIKLPTVDGGEWTWHLCRLDLLMIFFLKDGGFYRSIVQQAVDSHGHVLSLCTYADEATPGDAFSPDNKRKSYCIYVGIMQCGRGVLSREEAWLPLALIRSSKVTTIKGGLPCVFEHLLRSWFIELNINSVGVMLDLGEPTVVTFDETLFIKDLDGFRAALGWKGSSSLRPCFKCRNCMIKGHHSVTATSWQVDITETNDARFDLASDADIFDVVDLIEAARADPLIRACDCDDLEKAHGFNHIPNGRVRNRPASTYDWLPTLLIFGSLKRPSPIWPYGLTTRSCASHAATSRPHPLSKGPHTLAGLAMSWAVHTDARRSRTHTWSSAEQGVETIFQTSNWDQVRPYALYVVEWTILPRAL